MISVLHSNQIKSNQLLKLDNAEWLPLLSPEPETPVLRVRAFRWNLEVLVFKGENLSE